jgi:hypothetical protein
MKNRDPVFSLAVYCSCGEKSQGGVCSLQSFLKFELILKADVVDRMQVPELPWLLLWYAFFERISLSRDADLI